MRYFVIKKHTQSNTFIRFNRTLNTLFYFLCKIKVSYFLTLANVKKYEIFEKEISLKCGHLTGYHSRFGLQIKGTLNWNTNKVKHIQANFQEEPVLQYLFNECIEGHLVNMSW